ncbi:hypothetical protein ABIC60_003744 [Phyllobacterium ifriqiyense]
MKLEVRLPQYLVNAEQFTFINKNRDITLNHIAEAAGCSELAIVRISGLSGRASFDCSCVAPKL